MERRVVWIPAPVPDPDPGQAPESIELTRTY